MALRRLLSRSWQQVGRVTFLSQLPLRSCSCVGHSRMPLHNSSPVHVAHDRRMLSHLLSEFQVETNQPEELPPSEHYMRLVERQSIKLDSQQLDVTRVLDDLHRSLCTFQPPPLSAYDAHVVNRIQLRRQEGLKDEHDQRLQDIKETYAFVSPHRMHVAEEMPAFDDSELERLRREREMLKSLPPSPRGLYLWGSVGSGKTLMMDLFFESAPVQQGRKLRIHFHSFMRDVHQMFHRLHQHCAAEQRQVYDHDLIQLIARGIASQAYLVCFDEMQMPDVATAGYLYRLFRQLMDYGVILVATSNRAPQDLYQGHFRETLFEPFVQLLMERCQILEMSGRDYRRCMLADDDGQLAIREQQYLIGPQAGPELQQRWEEATTGLDERPTSLTVFGRTVPIMRSTRKGHARFRFSELCATPLGPADYLAIARNFHTVFLDGIPKMSMSTRNEARRFISLVDALYECRCKLVCSAAVPADMLFLEIDDPEHDRFEIMHGEMMGQMLYDLKRDGQDIYKHTLFSGKEELFASERCVSRLAEMQSPTYLEQNHQPELGLVGLDCGHLPLSPERHQSIPADQVQAEALQDRRKKPKLGDKHFWGFGWWERIRARKAQATTGTTNPSMQE